MSKNLKLNGILSGIMKAKLPLYKGFDLGSAPGEFSAPISQRVVPLVNAGILKPGASAAISYFMLEQSTRIAILYTSASNSGSFTYHKFSDTCVLRSDTTVSCRIFEQDMDIGCIVQCDQTRVEAFKLRVKVDEIEGGTKDKLSGVDVIKLEGYKIPVNYSVLHIVKGENLDFVVVNKTDADESRGEDKYFILMYDTSSGLIVYRMPQSEVCKNKSDVDCNLATTYIYQMSNNRIMIVPKNTPLNETLYIKKQKPHIEFNAEELEKLENLDGYALRIQGLTNHMDIPLKQLFLYKEDSLTWVYIVIGVLAFVSLIGIFALVLYNNWGADDEESSPYKKEEKKKRAKKSRDHDDQFASFTTEKTSARNGLKESLIRKE